MAQSNKWILKKKKKIRKSLGIIGNWKLLEILNKYWKYLFIENKKTQTYIYVCVYIYIYIYIYI